MILFRFWINHCMLMCWTIHWKNSLPRDSAVQCYCWKPKWKLWIKMNINMKWDDAKHYKWLAIFSRIFLIRVSFFCFRSIDQNDWISGESSRNEYRIRINIPTWRKLHQRKWILFGSYSVVATIATRAWIERERTHRHVHSLLRCSFIA